MLITATFDALSPNSWVLFSLSCTLKKKTIQAKSVYIREMADTNHCHFRCFVTKFMSLVLSPNSWVLQTEASGQPTLWPMGFPIVSKGLRWICILRGGKTTCARCQLAGHGQKWMLLFPESVFERRDCIYIKSSWLATAPGGKKDISRSGESQRLG